MAKQKKKPVSKPKKMSKAALRCGSVAVSLKKPKQKPKKKGK